MSKLIDLYERRHKRLLRNAPFTFRITQWGEVATPVIVVKQRIRQQGGKARGKLIARGHIKGDALRRLTPLMKAAVSRVTDAAGVPLELERYFTREGLHLRLTLPIDDEAGAKLAVIARLAQRLPDLDRTELLARRVLAFTREEGLYWLSRITDYGGDANRWAVSGLRLMLAGQPGDEGVERMLARLRVARARQG